MNWYEFLGKVVNAGENGAKADYSKPSDKMRLDGSLKGFEECWGKSPAELEKLLGEARMRMVEAFTEDAEDYWYWKCREAEIEWVCNVMGAAAGTEIAGVGVTARGMFKAAEIVAKEDGCLAVERGG